MKKQFNIEHIINQRLLLQTVKKTFFDNYDILDPVLDKFKRPIFLRNFSSWNRDEQDKFLSELGGPTNIRKTRFWMEGLIRKEFNNKKEFYNKESKQIKGNYEKAI